jgi:hypothetical protein
MQSGGIPFGDHAGGGIWIFAALRRVRTALVLFHSRLNEPADENRGIQRYQSASNLLLLSVEELKASTQKVSCGLPTSCDPFHVADERCALDGSSLAT